ncbi:hypothetical protein FISHEDRAFT_22909, partial [Fistulina hepatica ATCC 64428]
THDDRWDLNTPPDVNATGHLIFDTASALLQHWPNTRHRNGHSLVRGTVKPGTTLYHAGSTKHGEMPTVPEWTATDPEHSLLFCREREGAGCWLLNLVTVRPLKVLYFDGSSAAKMDLGSMDSQDIVAWGDVVVERARSERERIVDLCAWGADLDVDGFVRMEMDFEIMLCDFAKSVELASALNLATPQKINLARLDLEVMQSGSWHNHYPGDKRVQLDYSQLISFYDTSLVPSLVAARFGVERWDHRILNIDPADVTAVMARLNASMRGEFPGSEIDWETLIRVIVDRYGDRLELVDYLLNVTLASGGAEETAAAALRTQDELRTILAPYILYTAKPSDDTSVTDLSWASPVYEQCTTTHTRHIVSSPVLSSSLNPSEHTLLRAIFETTREICRVTTRMWATGVVYGLDAMLTPDTPFTERGQTASALAGIAKTWHDELSGLRTWLDWHVWVKCQPACSFEEFCYLPTWPFLGGGGPGGGHRPPGDGRKAPGRGPEQAQGSDPVSASSEEDNWWKRPQPKCVRRVAPF